MQAVTPIGEPFTERKDLIKDLLVSLSLACLCFIRVWSAILNPRFTQFFAETVQNRFDYLAILLNTAALVPAFFFAVRFIRRFHTPLVRRLACLGVVAMLLPFADFLRRSLGVTIDDIVNHVGKPGLAIVGVFTVFCLLRFYIALNRLVYAALVVLTPFSVMVLGSAVYLGVSGNLPDTGDDGKPFPHAPATAHPAHRTVWVIFDELDQSVLFQRRPAGLALPNLDAFARDSVVAENAFPPAGRTLLSIPSLLTGKIVDHAELKNSDRLYLRFKGEKKPAVFRDSDSVISDLTHVGKRVAIVGWYFPYDRIFPESDTRWVKWGAFPQTQNFSGRTLKEALAAQWRYVLRPQRVLQDVGTLYTDLHQGSLLAVGSPAADLVYLHYPTPHPPGIFDPKKGEISPAYTSMVTGYINNLQLVDRAVGDIMATLQKTGLAERTTVIVTSDHWWRAAPMLDGQLDHRVPFMVRFPSGGGRKFSPTVNTVISAELIRRLDDGRIKNPDDLVEFLGQKAMERNYHYGPTGEMLE